MRILVINCGSSSVKYQLFDMANESLLAKGIVEKIGEGASAVKHSARGRDVRYEAAIANHEAAFGHIRRALMDPATGAVRSADDIDAIGHRVVHGGETFVQSTLINAEVIATLEEYSALAPLHNPPNLVGIRCADKAFPGKPHVAVFDTAFHQTMPRHAFVYALPYELYEKGRIRRYGFHGTSHRFVTMRAAQFLAIPLERFNAITCHLGNGCSMAAVACGRSVDTTMGLTPLEGLVMGTRSGDLDPAIIFHLARTNGWDLDSIDALLNKKSGLLGLSGLSNDCRTLVDAAPTDERAKLALDVFCYRIRKYIGAYLAVLGRTDAVIFTGGIGENSVPLRRQVLEGLDTLGIELDPEANEGRARVAQPPSAESSQAGAPVPHIISKPASRVRVLVVPTNEELLIARDTAAIAGGG
ncbi:MAG: acetate kinase [Planctomycetes bacterium]|nr:acetate kinase [Planctomycetota bacterium]